jgi:hypothetical protein
MVNMMGFLSCFGYSAFCQFIDDTSAPVMTAMAACAVRKSRLTAVRAVDRGCGLGAGIELGASFVPSGLGHFGFWICHDGTL